jgi:hypothetical protein
MMSSAVLVREAEVVRPAAERNVVDGHAIRLRKPPFDAAGRGKPLQMPFIRERM